MITLSPQRQKPLLTLFMLLGLLQAETRGLWSEYDTEFRPLLSELLQWSSLLVIVIVVVVGVPQSTAVSPADPTLPPLPLRLVLTSVA